MKLLVDAMDKGASEHAAIWRSFAAFAGLVAVENALWRLSGWSGARAFVKVGVDFRLDLFRHVSRQGASFFAERLSGSLGNRISSCSSALQAIECTLAWSVIPPITGFVGAALVLTSMHWPIAATLAVAVAVLATVLIRMGIKGRPLHRESSQIMSEVGGELVDVVSNISLVRAFTGAEREAERLRHRLGVESAAHLKSWMYTEKMRVLHDVALWVLSAGMFGWAITLWFAGKLSVGDVVAINSLTFTILHSSRDLSLSLLGLTEHVSRISEAMGDIAVPVQVTDVADAVALQPTKGAVTFTKVNFAYGPKVPALRNLDLTIAAGQKVGIVGPSGAGKSTVLSLLQRLYDVNSGTIDIDGQNIALYAQDSLRRNIAVVPQEVLLFNRTILENIRYGRPEASDEEVLAAARAARCHDFIMALPDGYQTMVGERGTKLSGGQRQRLGIARAILKDAPIIILDEATSALDSESEVDIQKALMALTAGRTVVSVAHRLSTLAGFDRILVMRDGQIVEDGHPADLIANGGDFHSLWRLQTQEVFARAA